MRKAEYYQPQNNRILQCRLCNHFCAIKPGQTGLCQVRKNLDGELYSLVYGYPAAVNIDPVEKKPLFHFQPGSPTYSLGTLGCNLRCANCQNHDLSQAKAVEQKIKQLDFLPPEKVVEEALGNDCPSISCTYNEPTVFAEYALDIMRLAQENGLKNIWVTNGFMSGRCLDCILPYLDAANIDIKSIDEYFYRENCGASLRPVLDNAIRLKAEQVHLEVTTLLIPTLTDDIGMLERLADFIVRELGDDTPWHLSKFSAPISWKLKKLPSAEDDLVYQAYAIGKEAGLKYVYTGNLPGDQKENTYCPKCGELAIRRFGYSVERYDAGGRCPACDRSLDIIE